MPIIVELAQEIEDLRLDGDVERRGRLVGDEQLRIAEARSRSSRAVACRQRTDAGIANAAAGPGMPTRPRSSTARLAAPPWRSAMAVATAPRSARSIAGPGSARSSDPGRRTPISCPAGRVARLRQLRTVVPPEGCCPAAIRPGVVDSDHDRRCVTLFPEPDSPTMPSVSPGRTVKLTPSTARMTPASVWKYVWRSSTWRMGTSRSTAGRPARPGSAASGTGVQPVSRPSPRKLKPRTTVRIARPGNVATHHCAVRRRPSAIMEPHSAVGGTTPSPRKLRPAKVRMAAPTSSVISTISGPAALGRMWNPRILAGE